MEKLRRVAGIIFVLSFILGAHAFALDKIFQTGDSDEIVEYIDELVQKKSSNKGPLDSLIEVLKNPATEIRVRERAAWALGQLRYQKSVPSLLEAAQHKGLLIRSAALDALVRLRTREALSTFVKMSEEDPILSLRQRATLALGLLQWEKTIPTLVKLSSDAQMEIQGAAALAMAATHSKKNDFSQVLKEMSQEPDAHVKKRAEMGLDFIHKKSTSMKQYLSSEDSDLRLFSAVFFKQYGSANDLSHLKKSSQGEADDDIRWEIDEAVKAIQKRGAAAKAAAEKKKKEEAEKAKKPNN